MQDPYILVIAIVLCITAIVLTSFYFKHRGRLKVLEAVQTSLDKNGSADPSLVNALDLAKPNPIADLRRGLVLFAIALATVSFALFVGERDAIGPLTGIAAFPALLGLTYTGLYFFRTKQEAAEV